MVIHPRNLHFSDRQNVVDVGVEGVGAVQSRGSAGWRAQMPGPLRTIGCPRPALQPARIRRADQDGGRRRCLVPTWDQRARPADDCPPLRDGGRLWRIAMLCCPGGATPSGRSPGRSVVTLLRVYRVLHLSMVPSLQGAADGGPISLSKRSVRAPNSGGELAADRGQAGTASLALPAR